MRKKLYYLICGILFLVMWIPTIYWMQNPKLTQMQVFIEFWFIYPIVIGVYTLVYLTLRRQCNFIKSLFCPKCKSFMSMEYSSMWNGGWNNLCEQAIARSGNRCFECGHKEWMQTDDEFEATLPSWCDSHRQHYQKELDKIEQDKLKETI